MLSSHVALCRVAPPVPARYAADQGIGRSCRMVALCKPQSSGCVRALFVAGLLTILSTSSGCETAAGTGATAGGLLGAGVGALAGHCPGAALAGAAIGAGAGTLAGAGVDIAR